MSFFVVLVFLAAVYGSSSESTNHCSSFNDRSTLVELLKYTSELSEMLLCQMETRLQKCSEPVISYASTTSTATTKETPNPTSPTTVTSTTPTTTTTTIIISTTSTATAGTTPNTTPPTTVTTTTPSTTTTTTSKSTAPTLRETCENLGGTFSPQLGTCLAQFYEYFSFSFDKTICPQYGNAAFYNGPFPSSIDVNKSDFGDSSNYTEATNWLEASGAPLVPEYPHYILLGNNTSGSCKVIMYSLPAYIRSGPDADQRTCGQIYEQVNVDGIFYTICS